jgi:tight adherence protein B
MTAGTVTLLFLGSFILVMGLAGAALLMDKANREGQRVRARLASMGAAPPPSAAAPLIGCDYPRRHDYPIRWWIVPILGMVAGRAAVWVAHGLFGAAAWAILPLVGWMACRSMYGKWNGKRRDRLLEQFPDALGMIVRTVRVGVPVLEGIRLVGREADDPTREEFRVLVEEIGIGVTLDVALRGTADRTGIAEYRFFATAVALQMQTGGGLSDALEILADVVRKRLALRDRGFALTSEARSSAMVLGAMPFFVGLLMAIASPGYIDPLFTTPLGSEMLGAGSLSLFIGIAVMRMFIRRTLS